MLDKVESDFREINMEDASSDDIIEFMKLWATFSIDINSKDPNIISWVYKHKDWIEPKKKEGDIARP